LQTSPTITRH